MLIGGSTASARSLNIPNSIREPFNTAVSELEKVVGLFQDAEIQTGTDHAKLCISQAYTALKAVCDDEDARIEIERAARKAARLSLDKDDSQDEGDDSWDN